jgi:hypothetical protein
MGNLTTKNTDDTSDTINTLNLNNKLSSKIIDILNKNYKIGDLDNNILIKRAFCTGKHQIPINFPHYDDSTDSIKDYTINFPVYKKDSDGNLNEILKETDVEAGNIYNEVDTTNGQTVEYGRILNASGFRSSSEGCNTLYTGKPEAYGEVKDNIVEYINITKTLCGAIYNERENFTKDERYHGRYPNSSREMGNDYVVNPYPECSCVLSPWKLNRAIYFTPGSLGTLDEPFKIAQMFDARCTKEIEQGAITTTKIVGNVNVCVNNVVVANNIAEEDFGGKGGINSDIGCNIGDKKIDFKPNIINKFAGGDGGTGADVTKGAAETKQVPGADTPDIGPLPTMPPDLVKQRNLHIIIVATVVTIVITILLLIIANKLL